MLMRTDPFRDLDRLTQQLLGTAARPAAMAMDAWRDGDEFVIELDVPGVSADSIDIDVERNVPLLVSNDAASGAPTQATLALAADTGSFRYALLGANAPSDLAHAPPAPGSAGARMKDFVLRLVKWLTKKDPGTGAGMKIVLAHLADGYWFKHDEGTALFFAGELPEAAVNAPDSCESGALAGCLDGASLLVISDEDGDADDDHPVPADIPAVMKALEAAKSAGIPVLYLQFDGGLTPLGEQMMRFFQGFRRDAHPMAVMVGVVGAMISSASPNRVLATEFIERYLLSSKGLRAMNDHVPLGVPANRALYEELKSDPLVAGTYAAAEAGSIMPNLPEMARFWTAMNAAVQNIAQGREEVRAGLARAERRVRGDQ